MVSEKPEISIIIPTYNRAHFILETISTIKNQSFEKWECLIIDDNSTDNTKEILDSILNSDARFRYFNRSSKYLKGPSGCRNQGLDLAHGKYIIFFDSDDIIHPENLQTCFEVLINSDYEFCRYDKLPFRGDWQGGHQFKIEDFEIQNFSINNISSMVTMESGFACCTVMWKKNALNGMRFDEELSYAEEWEYYTRLLSQGISGASINRVLYFNRKHPESNTGEFWAKHPVRRKSKLDAVKKVIDTLAQRELLSADLIKYFIRLGFILKEYMIIKWVLRKSNSNWFCRLKYYLGYKFYPFIRPVFLIKSKFVES